MPEPLSVEVVMRRDEHGMWFAETPNRFGLTGALGHQGWHPFLNTPWAALSCMLRAWDYWRPGGGHEKRYEAWKQSGAPCPRCEASGFIESIDGTTIPCLWCSPHPQRAAPEPGA